MSSKQVSNEFITCERPGKGIRGAVLSSLLLFRESERLVVESVVVLYYTFLSFLMNRHKKTYQSCCMALSVGQLPREMLTY